VAIVVMAIAAMMSVAVAIVVMAIVAMMSVAVVVRVATTPIDQHNQ
jgi:hypothetical protein